MSHESFPKSKNETKPEENEGEKILNPEEIEVLKNEMGDYTAQLKVIIEEKGEELKTKKGKERAKLEAEIEELQEQYDGLTEMCSGDFEEEVTIKDRK